MAHAYVVVRESHRGQASPDSSPRTHGPDGGLLALPRLPSLAVQAAIDAPRGGQNTSTSLTRLRSLNPLLPSVALQQLLIPRYLVHKLRRHDECSLAASRYAAVDSRVCPARVHHGRSIGPPGGPRARQLCFACTATHEPMRCSRRQQRKNIGRGRRRRQWGRPSSQLSHQQPKSQRAQ